MTRSTFAYTRAYGNGTHFQSSAVDGIYYNEDTSTLGVQWSDSWTTVYAYADVTEEEVEDLLDGSVGSNVSGIIKTKQALGKFDCAREAPAQTKEYSLQTPAPEPVTKEYSLQSPPAEEARGGINLGNIHQFTVFFDYDGSEREWTSEDGESYKDAVDRLNSFAEAIGLDICLKGVYISFED